MLIFGHFSLAQANIKVPTKEIKSCYGHFGLNPSLETKDFAQNIQNIIFQM